MSTHIQVISSNESLIIFQNIQSAESILSDEENDSEDEMFNKLRFRKAGRQEMTKLLTKNRHSSDHFETELGLDESDL